MPVEGFVENVFSMSAESRQSFTDVLGSVLIDAKYFSACRAEAHDP